MGWLGGKRNSDKRREPWTTSRRCWKQLKLIDIENEGIVVDDEIFKTLQEKGKCVDDEIDEKNHKPISCAKNSSNFITTEIDNEF